MASSESAQNRQSLFRRFETHLWRRVLSGFLVLVPLLVTLIILQVIFGFVDDAIRPFVSELQIGRDKPLDFAGLGVVVTLILFYVVGAFFAGSRSRAWQDAVLTKIPIVKSIYGVARQATDAIASSADHYKRVVFLEWPRPGIWALGFVTGYVDGATQDRQTIAVVYIPTVPNPTSGMLAWIPEEEIVEAGFSVEQAMKMVFSGGIVLPKTDMSPDLSTPTQIRGGQDH